MAVSWRGRSGFLAGAIGLLSVACSSAIIGGEASGGAFAAADDLPVPAASPALSPLPEPVPSPAPTLNPESPGGLSPTTTPDSASDVSVEGADEATPVPRRTPIPPQHGRTPTPMPVYRPPETRTGDAAGLVTTADNIVDLYDPFQPEGDREIGYAQYRPAVPRDSIIPIYVPRIREPNDLQIPLTLEELVMGVEIGGEARAYPIGLMRFREMANDTLGGVPILVSW